jgi:hypothetical protein
MISFVLVVRVRLSSEFASLALGLVESEVNGGMLRIASFRMFVFNCMYDANNGREIM